MSAARALLLAFFLSSLPAAPALAQTLLGQTPPGASVSSSSSLPPGMPADFSAAPAPSLPDAAAAQARAQRAGQFGALARPGLGGGQIQEAFDALEAGQGVHRFDWCAACVYKIRTREFMITTVVLPVAVMTVDIGDPAGFQVSVRGPRVVAVRPNGYGMDTSMTVHGADGSVWPFYVRAEGFNSTHVPDLLVRIGAPDGFGAADGTPRSYDQEHDYDREEGREAEGAQGTGAAAARDDEEEEMATADAAGAAPDDWVEHVAFDPGALRGWRDYRLWGSDELRPEVVFRDDRFTYLQYGGRWAGLDLPAAYVVVDGVDELVNTRVQGRAYIIESVAPLITLKSGRRYLCVEYAPADAPPGRAR